MLLFKKTVDIAPRDLDFSRHIVKGATPFIILQIVGVILLIAFPRLVLWLPGIMFK